ncbi:MAG: TIGR02206 family membrane protein [Verrucomicrobia bacterium]|nr:TIGR02206 family membrane protein [Verrucomicrobiota bacterium]
MAALSPVAFHSFGTSHQIVLGVFLLTAITLILLTRVGVLRVVRPLELTLALLLLLEWPFNLWVAWQYEMLQPSNVLPLHLCDVAAFLGALALIKREPEVCELLYFWGLAGTLQGLITPALTAEWPHPRFVMFFVLHCGVVLAALQVVLGRGITPRRGAALRAISWLAVYAAVAGTMNFLLRLVGCKANFGFLCEKPPTASLFDYLGSWPWYIGAILPLAWVFFSILDLPFLILRRRRG